MASYNKVLLMGNLTRDPELRYTPGGTAVADLGLAVNRSWRGQDGEMKEETTFVDIVVWGRQAETSSQYLSKGRPVFIEGRLQLDSWQTPDGQKRNRLRVVAERVQFLGGGRSEGAPPRGRAPGGEASPPRSARPPAEPAVQDRPPDEEFNLDDIPF